MSDPYPSTSHSDDAEHDSDECDSDMSHESNHGGYYDGEDCMYNAGSDVQTDDEYEDEDYPSIDPKSPAGRIGKLLKKEVKHVGEFTFGGSADSLPVLPGLEAESLASCGRMAPFGLGSDTIMDPEVRRTWQFDASQVSIANKAWDRGLAQLMATVATRLGCPDMPLECHLYKLLLYGPGCHFVRHRDTEKEDRMFATLVIQLPSAHEGGELVVYQPDGSAVTHDFGAADGSAEFSPHYALHYADTEHELKTVTSGYRLALVYSICWPEGHKQIDLLQSLPAQRKLAAHLSSLAKSKRSFFLMLKHEYTPASIGRLRLKALKGKDRARTNLIQAANRLVRSTRAFTLYLVQGTWDVNIGVNDCSDWESFDEWIDVDTGKRYESMQVQTDLGQLINPDDKSKKDLWAVEKERISTKYTGNEGYQIHNRYSCYLLVGIPKSRGPFALLRYLGSGALTQIIDTNTCCSADITLLLTTLPKHMKQVKDLSEFNLESDLLDPFKTSKSVPTTETDFPARLLNIIVARSFVECIPTFFGGMPDPLSAAMIPVYLQAMKLSADSTASSSPPTLLWSTMRALLIANLSKSKESFMFGLKLVCDAAIADVPHAMWHDVLTAVASLPPPAHMIKSMPSVLLCAVKFKHVWQAVSGPIIQMLIIALSAQPSQTDSTSTPVLETVFKLSLSLALTAAEAGAEDLELQALLNVIVHCRQPRPSNVVNRGSNRRESWSNVGALFADLADDFKAATRVSALWRALVPLMCELIPRLEEDGLAQSIVLVSELLNHCAPAPVASELWHPILDAATSTAEFLPRGSMRNFGKTWYSADGYEEAGTHIASFMRNPSIWGYLSPRVVHEVEQDSDRFQLGVAILKAAQKESAIPTSHWLPLVPVVFATIPPVWFDESEEELAFWSVVAANPLDTDVIHRVVTAYVSINEPQELKAPVSAILTLLSTNALTIPARPFLPLLEARLERLQLALPPTHPATSQSTATSSSSASSPAPSWVMHNASYPSDARIDQFLKTNERTLRITGFKNGLGLARSWARDHQPPTAQLRKQLLVEAGGTGSNVFVQVTKVRVQSSGSSWMPAVEPVAGLQGGGEIGQLRNEADRLSAAIACIHAGKPIPGACAE